MRVWLFTTAREAVFRAQILSIYVQTGRVGLSFSCVVPFCSPKYVEDLYQGEHETMFELLNSQHLIGRLRWRERETSRKHRQGVSVLVRIFPMAIADLVSAILRRGPKCFFPRLLFAFVCSI